MQVDRYSAIELVIRIGSTLNSGVTEPRTQAAYNPGRRPSVNYKKRSRGACTGPYLMLKEMRVDTCPRGVNLGYEVGARGVASQVTCM
jgi:hypothetical protein